MSNPTATPFSGRKGVRIARVVAPVGLVLALAGCDGGDGLPAAGVKTPQHNCTPGYSPCLPPAPDYDCAGGSGNGPEYAFGSVEVTGSDPYDLDRDGDGIGCD